MRNLMRFICKVLLLNIILVCKASAALECYITIVKASCWKNYDLTVTVNNAETGMKLGEITVYEGRLWGREKFDCTPGITLSLEAGFSPEIWSGDNERVFKATRFWKLPKKPTNAEALGWNVTVCYPKWFSDVPTPPDASAKCECDLQEVPKFEVGS